MPILVKAPKEPKRNNKREDRQKIYQSQQWKKLRQIKLMYNPLCELCQAKGIIKPAIDIHHKDSFLNYDGAMRLYKAYDYSNLLSLCKECHSEVHKSGVTHG